MLITGDIVGQGFAVEIEDRGLGHERRASWPRLNASLANPPPFDLSGADQLGLFVAGQLAKRHDIQITLRRSPYGGTTAIVLIPNTLVVSEESYQQDATDQGAGVQLSGRHAARDNADRFAPVTGDWPAPGRPAATAQSRRRRRRGGGEGRSGGRGGGGRGRAVAGLGRAVAGRQRSRSLDNPRHGPQHGKQRS